MHPAGYLYIILILPIGWVLLPDPQFLTHYLANNGCLKNELCLEGKKAVWGADRFKLMENH